MGEQTTVKDNEAKRILAAIVDLEAFEQADSIDIRSSYDQTYIMFRAVCGMDVHLFLFTKADLTQVFEGHCYHDSDDGDETQVDMARLEKALATLNQYNREINQETLADHMKYGYIRVQACQE